MGSTTIRRRRGAGVLLTLVLTLLASLFVVVATSGPAAAAKGTVRGQVISTTGGPLKIRMMWFDKNWGFLGQRKLNGNIYSLTLPEGTYHLQFVDLRPSYDVTKYAPTDIKVTIQASNPVQRDVKMRRGAAFTGTVKAGGKPAGGARIVAASTDETSYETKANSLGQFALGGLPSGDYSVFSYDRQKVWVGKSLWVPKVVRPEIRNIAPKMKTKGGSMLVDLKRPDGSPMKGSFFVTAVSKASGQFWTARAQGGVVSFADLYPGRYKMVAPGVGVYLAHTGTVKGGYVRSGRADLAASFSWTHRGAWFTGAVYDQEDPSIPLEDALVLVYDKAGHQLGSGLTNSDGLFRVEGPIDTQTGVTVAVQSSDINGYLHVGSLYCKFERVELGGYTATRDTRTEVGEVLLPHRPADEQDTAQCAPS
jgi:hypothetical protein